MDLDKFKKNDISVILDRGRKFRLIYTYCERCKERIDSETLYFVDDHWTEPRDRHYIDNIGWVCNSCNRIISGKIIKKKQWM